MPDLMNHEFRQIHEAIDIAYEILCTDKPQMVPVYPESLSIVLPKLEKIKAARELMADLAGGNSR